jgi:glycosyltransferase involved in cell wall biosynthesis
MLGEQKKVISIFTPCYNEQDNVEKLIAEVKKIFGQFPQYHFEHVFIDNHSTDNTVSILRRLAANDKQIKVIVNVRNFGHIRSPYYGLLACKGDAVISLVADLQDPPEMIPDFIRKWEEGFKSVMAVKKVSEENKIMFFLRGLYYRFVARISEVQLVNNATGAGLFDRCVIDVLRKIQDPYPYFRGLVCDVGFPIATVPFAQPRRKITTSCASSLGISSADNLGRVEKCALLSLVVLTANGSGRVYRCF